MGWKDAPVVAVQPKWASAPTLDEPAQKEVKQQSEEDKWLEDYQGRQRAVAEMLRNTPGSAIKFASNLAGAVLHPADAAKAILDLGAGSLRNVLPSSVSKFVDKFDPNPKAAEDASTLASNVGNAYKDRYGTLERVKKTIVEDPVGAAADLSTVLGVGGFFAPGKAGQALATASKYTNPVSAIGPAVDAAAQGAKWSGNWLMHSAIKPTIGQLKSGKADAAINTLLEHGINPTRGGMDKLRGLIDEKNQQISGAIGASKATINPDDVLAYLGETKRRFLNQVDPSSDIASIQRVGSGFSTNPLSVGPIPVQTAQNMKQGTYHILKDKYGQIGTAETEAQKTLARGLKEEIAAKVPKVAELNAQESKLINALEVGERRAMMELNKNPLGLSILANNKAALAVYMADKSALFKSLVARMMNNAGLGVEKASSIAEPYGGLLRGSGLGAAQAEIVRDQN